MADMAPLIRYRRLSIGMFFPPRLNRWRGDSRGLEMIEMSCVVFAIPGVVEPQDAAELSTCASVSV